MIFLQKKFIQFFETTHKKWRKANYILNYQNINKHFHSH